MNEATQAVTHAIRRLVWATVGLFLATAALALFVFIYDGIQQADLHQQQRDLAAQQAETRGNQKFIRVQQRNLVHLAKTTNTALCRQRDQLKDSVATAERYLEKTPNAIPGISPAQIRRSIRLQRRSLKSYEDLDCAPTVTIQTP